MSYDTKTACRFALQFPPGETRAMIVDLAAEVERLDKLTKFYPRVAGENEQLREEVDLLKTRLKVRIAICEAAALKIEALEKKLEKTVDFIDFQHRPLFTAVEHLLMNTMKDDLAEVDIALEYCSNADLGPRRKE